MLVSWDGKVKIADFGLACKLSKIGGEVLTKRIVTLWYRAPELLLGSKNYDASVDLWSLGCIIAEMFKTSPLLNGRNEVEQIHKMIKLCGNFPDDYARIVQLAHNSLMVSNPRNNAKSKIHAIDNITPGATQLLRVLLNVVPSERGSATATLEHAFYSGTEGDASASLYDMSDALEFVPDDLTYEADPERCSSIRMSKDLSHHSLSNRDSYMDDASVGRVFSNAAKASSRGPSSVVEHTMDDDSAKGLPSKALYTESTGVVESYRDGTLTHPTKNESARDGTLKHSTMDDSAETYGNTIQSNSGEAQV